MSSNYEVDQYVAMSQDVNGAHSLLIHTTANNGIFVEAGKIHPLKF